MKQRYLMIASAALLGAATFLLWPKPENPPVSKVTTPATAGGRTLTTNTDPTLVFQKAFWRRPGSDDKILHAERREWSSEDGVQKWQWFISVSPGTPLLEYLKTNPFSLAISPSAGVLEMPPKWFPKPAGNFQIHQNPEGRFMLMLSADRKQLYATDSGSGFAPPNTAP